MAHSIMAGAIRILAGVRVARSVMLLPLASREWSACSENCDSAVWRGPGCCQQCWARVLPWHLQVATLMPACCMHGPA